MTTRLRLEPVGPEHAGDLWRLTQDDAVAAWKGGRWSMDEALRYAAAMARAWTADGVGKWIAYDRGSGELVGRGGLSRLGPGDAMTREIASALGGDGWVKDRLEVGWTVRADLWGRGYATEIGRAGLAFAFQDLGAEEVVAFTERHNRRSRAVMERLGMRFVGEFPGRGLVEGRTGVHDGAPFALYVSAREDLGGTVRGAARASRAGPGPARRARTRRTAGSPPAGHRPACAARRP
jgi:RimJ/RimL family protein N-acetyltransferase